MNPVWANLQIILKNLHNYIDALEENYKAVTTENAELKSKIAELQLLIPQKVSEDSSTPIQE